MHDIIIIGGGHNGLVAACYLAKAGLKTLVLERRDQVGGGAITEEIHPGFRCSTLAHATGPFSQKIATDLDLARHGLEFIKPAARLTVLNPNGASPTIYDDPSRTVASLENTLGKRRRELRRIRQELPAHRPRACAVAFDDTTDDREAGCRRVVEPRQARFVVPRFRETGCVSFVALGTDGRCGSGGGVV